MSNEYSRNSLTEEVVRDKLITVGYTVGAPQLANTKVQPIRPASGRATHGFGQGIDRDAGFFSQTAGAHRSWLEAGHGDAQSARVQGNVRQWQLRNVQTVAGGHRCVRGDDPWVRHRQGTGVAATGVEDEIPGGPTLGLCRSSRGRLPGGLGGSLRAHGRFTAQGQGNRETHVGERG